MGEKMKTDIEHAWAIIDKHLVKLARIDNLEIKQRIAWNAGMEDVPDPDAYRVKEEYLYDTRIAKALGIEIPRSRVAIQEPNEAAIENAFRVMPAHLEICGYCGRPKKKGDWCGYHRCKSNMRRRGEI